MWLFVVVGLFCYGFFGKFDALFPKQCFDQPVIIFFFTACSFSWSEKLLFCVILTFWKIYLPRLQRKRLARKSRANFSVVLLSQWLCLGQTHIAGNSFRNIAKRRCVPSNFAGGKSSRNTLAVELSARESLLFAATFSSTQEKRQRLT